MHMVILQQVDQLTELAIVCAVGDCLLIWREFFLANATECQFLPWICLRQTLAAGLTGWPSDRRDSSNAGLTNRQARNIRQGLTANAAICREYGDKKGSREGASSRNR